MVDTFNAIDHDAPWSVDVRFPHAVAVRPRRVQRFPFEGSTASDGKMLASDVPATGAVNTSVAV